MTTNAMNKINGMIITETNDISNHTGDVPLDYTAYMTGEQLEDAMMVGLAWAVALPMSKHEMERCKPLSDSL